MSQDSARGLIALAQQQLQQGHDDGAIESLTLALGQDVNNAYAHALLAICLVRRNRLAAAQHEATAALNLAPQDWFSHLCAGKVNYAQRRPAQAEEHLKTAVELSPQNPWPLRELGSFYLSQDRPAQAREFIDAACALAPDDASNLAALARWHLIDGDVVRAEAIAREALSSDPQDDEALQVLGWAVLRQGRTDEAYEHALWVVRNAPTDSEAMRLLMAVKARRNPLLGLWFRFSMFVGGGSGRRTVLLLIGMYLGIRLLSLVLADLGYPAAASAVTYAWLAFCVYTWVAPTVFQRMLRKELEQVKLKPDF